jgi:hypothetical protein
VQLGDQIFQHFISNGGSSTGYVVSLQCFILVASPTCQDDREYVLVRSENVFDRSQISHILAPELCLHKMKL